MEPLTAAEVETIRKLPGELEGKLARLQQLEEQVRKWPEQAGPQVRDLEAKIKTLTDERSALETRLGARLDELNLRLNRPAGPDAQRGPTEDEKLARRAVDKLLRRNFRLDSLSSDERRAIEGDDAQSGGFLIPAPLRGPIIQELVLISPIRQACNPITITQGDSFEDPKDEGSFTGGWVGERESRPVTKNAGTSKFGIYKTELRELEAYPQITQRMIEDVGFDLVGYASKKIAQRFAQVEGAGFISGDDSPTQPEGITKNPDVDWTTTTGNATSITAADKLFDLMAAIPTLYAPGSQLFMTRKTSFALRKMKDSQGRYLWEPGLPAGLMPGLQGAGSLQTPANTFAGVQIVETPDLAELAAASKSIFMGNLAEAYRIVDKPDMRILQDPYSNKPYVGIYATKRVGGRVIVPKRIVGMTTGV